MAYAIFIHRPDSIYDDNPAEQYQFPRQYLSRAQASTGDWIIYYEPSNVPDSRGYFAVARVQQIIPDPKEPTMFLALIESGTYLDFASPVAFNLNGSPIEQGLLNESGRISGRAQAAVRPLSPSDFARIIELGLDEREQFLPRIGEAPSQYALQEEAADFVFDEPRMRLSQLVNRLVRDRVFRKRVLRAYDQRCAFTGLRLINGGGRAEVEAAHIKPVESNGPDIVSNGIALSGTAHWMYDRGLISLRDDLSFLVSPKVNDREGVAAILNSDGRAKPPVRTIERPRPEFLQWHRHQHGFRD